MIKKEEAYSKIKKNKLFTILFVFFSLGAFFVFGISVSWREEPRVSKIDSRESDENTVADKYYLNKDYKNDDPYLTKNPSLKDMLAGPIISELDPSIGDERAPVVIVYFSDFECKYCHEQEQVLKRILQNYKYYTRLVWKDYPENKVDSKTFQASIAARCANEQDRFWPYHDFLYEIRQDLDNELFLSIAKMVKLDINSFSTCLKAGLPKKQIFDNIEEANALGINGVPFMYINDQEVMGSINYADLEKIIKIELKKVGK